MVQEVANAKCKEERILVLLIIASGVAGLFLGRFLRAYALIPATTLIMVPAWYLGLEHGFARGVMAFVISAVVMQLLFCASLVAYLVIENLSLIDSVQSEASPPLPETRAAF
ncbi:hypothetical protein AYJ54_39305 [Bradyrhizobium centrolobii]|uniref:Uncharacterized protein n=1 Tax=Bradyrhizobium centrolobii TaxID=1505087 RepID=A0A176Z3Y1_9BRAD|nr:hypothetical protein [Bradyrhizobium centrolobii]OAF15431.1 hypothetical protein AYJ54_39305 [Bradyrhizobium centrolobii]